eukprot:CAMPEP_0201509850 /NCGR_PEP_ID=MMETSP0161_2-20130828/2788_1 /ASSEMBLY_ACC=CAM_ASM_000251 /TAXON_ID=180227 /ORGANISM="Neoparamoeba aestuarina, Strain SoJaBio B1-5/56/2" /LENGTH=299 /DNA_ID=CAMNT_0047904935 /DNA_START=60 /DNA_END=959 /DNA_ORIENTATION=+
MDSSSCPNCTKSSQHIEKLQILSDSQKEWILRLQKDVSTAHQILTQVKRKNQEVNNELVKSNIRAQKALQIAEKNQKEKEQRISQLEKEVEKLKNEKEQANGNAKHFEEHAHFLQDTVQSTLIQMQNYLNSLNTPNIPNPNTNQPEPVNFELDMSFSPLQTTAELERSFLLTPEPPTAKTKTNTREKSVPVVSSWGFQENRAENERPENERNPIEGSSSFWELSSIKQVNEIEPPPTPLIPRGEEKKRKRKKGAGKGEEKKRRREENSSLIHSHPSLASFGNKDPIAFPLKEAQTKKKR